MSRTMLLSEVDAVGGRFPDIVAKVRDRLAHAALPEAGDQVVPALAERIAADHAFCEDLHAAVDAICVLEPQISPLEVLGILVVAAAGPEQVAALAGAAGADLAARTIFNFVLQSRRRRQRVAAASPPPQNATADGLEADAPSVATLPRKPLVTATSPGNSAMLARALAAAAAEDVLAATTPVLREQTAHGTRSPHAVAEEFPRTVRLRREAFPSRPARASQIAGQELGEQEEEPEGPRRRWGMWTAVTCGVLMGFGLGAFAHFDHGATAPAVRSPAVEGTQRSNAPQGERSESLDELRTEIAALDSEEGVLPSRGERPVGRRTAPVRPGLRPQRTHGGDALPSAREPALAARENGPVLIVRTSSAATSRSASGAASARVALTKRTEPPPPPVSAAGKAADPGGTDGPGSNLLHTPGPMRLPQVITGSAGMMAANLMSSPAPAYPVAASAAGVQGEVIVEAVVGRDGGVVDMRVVSGPLLLRAAALDAVQRWHYRPYEVDGKPIEVATTARLEFRLDH